MKGRDAVPEAHWGFGFLQSAQTLLSRSRRFNSWSSSGDMMMMMQMEESACEFRWVVVVLRREAIPRDELHSVDLRRLSVSRMRNDNIMSSPPPSTLPT